MQKNLAPHNEQVNIISDDSKIVDTTKPAKDEELHPETEKPSNTEVKKQEPEKSPMKNQDVQLSARNDEQQPALQNESSAKKDVGIVHEDVQTKDEEDSKPAVFSKPNLFKKKN